MKLFITAALLALVTTCAFAEEFVDYEGEVEVADFDGARVARSPQQFGGLGGGRQISSSSSKVNAGSQKLNSGGFANNAGGFGGGLGFGFSGPAANANAGASSFGFGR